nr:cytochrome oxidase putative small subunit CydP [Methylosinus sp. Sm6]
MLAKIAALALLYFAFFSASDRPHLTPAAMAQKLAGDALPPR